MKFIEANNYDDLSKKCAHLIITQIESKPETILGLATGSTPLKMYNYLIEAYRSGLDFSKVITFNLDEYCGLDFNHPQSYRYYMDKYLFNNINIKKENIHIPDGMCYSKEKECTNYDASITKAGGIDLQVLGIGRNGHIGFNEPGDNLKIETHVTSLSSDTIKANSRFFTSIDNVPKYAITMGMGTIMKAKKIILLASGNDKAPIIAKLIKPFVDTEIPASMLHLHNDALLIADRDALNLANLKSLPNYSNLCY